MITVKVCRDCQNPDLVPRGKQGGFRNQCHTCWAATQRRRWAEKREKCRQASRASYAKHAEKRRAEAALYKSENREYYTLAEWFRKKGIPVGDIDAAVMQRLVEMRSAVKESARAIRIEGT